MDTEDFEEQLMQMSKPEIKHLKHQEMLAKEITGAKDKTVMTWWWLSIPLYVMAALLMKSFFMPGTSFISNLRELMAKTPYPVMALFIVLPLVCIISSIWSIRKIHFLSGSPTSILFMKGVWFQVLIIIFSVLILFIYLISAI